MKKFTLLLLLATSQLIFAQISNETKNEIRIKFEQAKSNYENKNYQDALGTIEEIEILTNDKRIATAQNLKVKTLIGLKEYGDAKKELDVLKKMNLSTDIIKEIATYESKIPNETEIVAKEETKTNSLNFNTSNPNYTGSIAYINTTDLIEQMDNVMAIISQINEIENRLKSNIEYSEKYNLKEKLKNLTQNRDTIYEKLRKAIQKVGREQGFDYVIDSYENGMLVVSIGGKDLMNDVKIELGL